MPSMLKTLKQMENSLIVAMHVFGALRIVFT